MTGHIDKLGLGDSQPHRILTQATKKKALERVQMMPNRLKYTFLFLKKLFTPRRGHFLVRIFANLMKGGFDNGQSSETLGSLDMSGAKKVNCPLEFSKSVSWMKKVNVIL